MPMKPFSPRPTRRPVSRADAQKSFVLNQFATPGLGSLMAGRILPGIGQLVVAVAGFALVTAWFVLTMIQTYRQLTDNAPDKSFGEFGAVGALVFAAAWLWSLVTSLSVLREARTAEQNVPPKIAGETLPK